jgi:hypothetical protein
LLGGFALVKEIDRLKADALIAIRVLLNPAHMSAPVEYAESLLRGFELAAKLADALHDELLDTNGETQVVRLMNEIVNVLDGIGTGRAALVVLLNKPDPSVPAGAFLIKLMPDRVIPILREIEDKERGSSSGSNAHWTLVRWKSDKKTHSK